MKSKILVFSVPFGGHLTILAECIRQLRDRYDIHLVVTGWGNIPSDTEGIGCPVDILDAGLLHETDPAVWTFPRMEQLLPRCLAIASAFKPDVILYDFFSPEGLAVGQTLGIPTISSIPAMIGPFTDRAYLDSKLSLPGVVASHGRLVSRYGLPLFTDPMEMISDGMHMPGERNIVWTWRSAVPSDWGRGRVATPYYFVGNIRARRLPIVPHAKPVVYMSFGTVVMNNLWENQPDVQRRMGAFLAAFAEGIPSHDVDVVFVSQGKRVLSRYPTNWRVVEHADQIRELAAADVFVTHGGGNSFNEALVQRVPMVCIPFFGDQPLVGSRIEALGIGKTMVMDDSVDTHKEKTFLDAALGKRTAQAVLDILGNHAYRNAFAWIDDRTDSLAEAFFG